MTAAHKAYDPFSGPPAGVTGRLTKLRDQLDWASNQDTDEKLRSLVFTNRLLVDLVEELALKVTELLPPES